MAFDVQYYKYKKRDLRMLHINYTERHISLLYMWPFGLDISLCVLHQDTFSNKVNTPIWYILVSTSPLIFFSYYNANILERINIPRVPLNVS